MGVTLRDRWQSCLRPLFLAALLTVAWIAWAAGSANAASDDLNSLGGVGRSAGSLLQETASTTGAVADPLTSNAAYVTTVPQVTSQMAAAVSDLAGNTPVPAIQDVPSPVAAAPFPVSGTAATLVDAVDSALSQTTDVVTTTVDTAASVATDTVNDAVADTVNDTVTDAVDAVVSVGDSLSPVLPGVPLPTVPVPAVPLPTLPVQLPEPGRSPAGVPPGFTKEPAATEGNGIDASAHAASAQPVRNAAGLTQPVRRAISPLDFLANTHALRALVATIGYVVSAAPAPETGPDPEEALRFTALYSQSGSATGSGSAGSEASADVAALWNPLHDARGTLMPDAAQVLAAGPSFDPGSSPD